MRTIKCKIVLLVLTLIAFPCLSQISEQQLNKLQNSAQKNIILYRIFLISNRIKSEYLDDDLVFFNHYMADLLFDYLPDNNCKLSLDIYKSDIIFPDTSFVLFEINKPIDEYECGKCRTQQQLFPDNNDTKFLLGINKNTSEIIFISGNIFISDYFKYFAVNTVDVIENITKYLEIRLFCVDDLHDLKFIKRSKRYAYYKLFVQNDIYRLKVSITKPSHIIYSN